MRRILIAILVFGLLGLAATVGISWWLAIDLQRSTYLNAGDYPLIWQRPGVLMQRTDARPPEVRERGENLEYERMREESDPPWWSAMRSVPNDGTRRVVEVASGWPLKTLRMVGEGEGTFTESVHMRFDGALIGDLALSRFGMRTMPITRLPVKPIWLNLIVSVAVWAALCALILNVPRFFRVIRWNLRREKGRCGWCGHDPRMQRSAVCTECGHDLDTPPRWLGGPSIAGAVLLLAIVLSAETLLLVQFLSHQPIQAIHWAAARGDLEGVRAEIENGADVNAQISYHDYPNRLHAEQGVSPLVIACQRSDVELLHYLLDVGADPSPSRDIRQSRYYNYNNYLWSSGISEASPFEIALEQGNREIASLLVKAGAAADASINFWDKPLVLAIRAHDDELVDLLISEAHRNEDAARDLADGLAVAVGYAPKYVDALLSAGAVPTAERWDVVATAMDTGDLVLVKKLIAAGAPVTHTAMSVAAAQGYDELEFLLRNGGKLTTRGNLGGTLFFQGAASDPRIWEALIEAGVDVNARHTNDGSTALMFAAESQNLELVEFLLKHGADVNARDTDEGHTALMKAVFSANVELIEFLLEHDADPTIANSEGQTPLDVAERLRKQSSYNEDLVQRFDRIVRLLGESITAAQRADTTMSDDG